MLEQNKIAVPEATEVIGELAALAEQLGSPDLTGLAQSGPAAELGRVRDRSELRHFLQSYSAHILVTSELTTISRAYQHASRSEARELIALEQVLEREPKLEALARASQHVGRTQLRRLRPLRDQRVVQRYLAAIELGEAKAWHTVVFGLVLAVFSVPLRQGLLHYARETLKGFIESAAARACLDREHCDELLDELTQSLPQAIDNVLKEEPRLLAL
jgi:urease accessory protein UreF